MSDDLTVLGPDGIRRSYDEHYDTMMDVEQDPTGAHEAIQRQHSRIEELEAKLAKALEGFESVRQSVEYQLQDRLYSQDADGWEMCADDIKKVVSTTLAELKGEK